jgi:hypothetical protein
MIHSTYWCYRTGRNQRYTNTDGSKNVSKVLVFTSPPAVMKKTVLKNAARKELFSFVKWFPECRLRYSVKCGRILPTFRRNKFLHLVLWKIMQYLDIYRRFGEYIAAICQWYSTRGTRTPGGMRRQFRGYIKLKIYIYYFMINTE